MKNRKIMILLAAAAAAGLLLSGCSGGADKTQTQETEEQAQESAGAEQETEAPQESTEAETEGQTQEDSGAKQETEAQKGSDAEQETEEGGLFGAFETVTLEGETATQEIFAEADLNMVNIWGTFCGPCISEMPELGELADEYEDQGLQVIGILTDVMEAEDETALLIVDETKADYTHLVLSLDLYNNYLSQVQAVPTTVFVDSEGNQVGEVYMGARSKVFWSTIVDELLASIS